jgi:hypothetical protein
MDQEETFGLDDLDDRLEREDWVATGTVATRDLSISTIA